MSFLTKYGTLWGTIPITSGNIYWIAPVSSTTAAYTIGSQSFQAADDNDGLSPERALATINRFRVLATANNGDIGLLLPGTHNASSLTGATASGNLALSKAGLTLIGLPYDPSTSKSYLGIRPQAVITAPASTVSVSVTAADNTLMNITFTEVSGQRTVDYTTAATRLTVRGCYFNMSVGAASTAGLAPTTATQAPTNMLVEDCIFDHDNTGTSDSYALDVGAGVGFLVRNNIFRHRAQGAGVVAWTTAVRVNDNANGTFDSNQIYTLMGSVAAITNGIQGVAMTGTAVLRLFRNLVGINVTNPFTGFAASDVDLLNNYVATVAGGTGGTLITSTT